MHMRNDDHLLTFVTSDNKLPSVTRMNIKLRVHDENAIDKLYHNATDIAGIVEQSLADVVYSGCMVENITIKQVTTREVRIRRKTVGDFRNNR